MRTPWSILILAAALGGGVAAPLFWEAARVHDGALDRTAFETIFLVLGAAAVGVIAARLLSTWLRSLAERQADAIRRL